MHKSQSELDDGFMNPMWQEMQEADMLLSIKKERHEVKEHVISNVRQTGLSHTEIILDNAANISMIKPKLLENVQEAKKKIKVKGVGGVQMIVSKVG